MMLKKIVATAECIFDWILSKTNWFLVHQIFLKIKGLRIPISLTILWMNLAILFMSNTEHKERGLGNHICAKLLQTTSKKGDNKE